MRRAAGAAHSRGMKIPDAVHTRQPWRIHELTTDFEILDVWSFRAPGAGPGDLAAMFAVIQAAGAQPQPYSLARLLFAVRWKLGRVFGWDEVPPGAQPLSARLPADLVQPGTDTAVRGLPFTLLYQLPDEIALEVRNRTVHGVAHLGWVRSAGGGYALQMAVLVKPNGLLGRAYLAAIAPFRHLVVYPAMTRQWEQAWTRRQPAIH